MKAFRSLLLAALASTALLSSLPAAAQSVNSSVYAYPGQRPFYSATKVGLSPASSATDFFTIIGSATKPVRVISLSCSGTSTAAATALVQVVKRSAANTTGTSAAATAVPFSSVYPAATAVVKSYTVNPGGLGASVGVVAVGNLTTTTAASTAVSGPTLTFDFSEQNIILNGVAQTLALNANAASFSSGASLNCTAKWAES